MGSPAREHDPPKADVLSGRGLPEGARLAVAIHSGHNPPAEEHGGPWSQSSGRTTSMATARREPAPPPSGLRSKRPAGVALHRARLQRYL